MCSYETDEGPLRGTFGGDILSARAFRIRSSASAFALHLSVLAVFGPYFPTIQEKQKPRKERGFWLVCDVYVVSLVLVRRAGAPLTIRA